MHDIDVHDAEIIDRVASSTGLQVNVAARVVEDVLAFYRQSTEQYVQCRHAELQGAGKKNPEIFRLIAGELSRRLVAPPVVSERQSSATLATKTPPQSS